MNILKKTLVSFAIMLLLGNVAMAQKVQTFVPNHSQLQQHSVATAQGTDTTDPIITIKTHLYDNHGAANNIQFFMLAAMNVQSTDIEVDFGYGRKTYTVTAEGSLSEDEDNEVITGGTLISGNVSSEGIVRIYGKASDIDYFDCHGSEIYDLDISRMTSLAILEVGHNELSHLDLSNLPYLEYLDLKDNTFENGLILGNHLYLKYLNVNQLGDHALDSTNGEIDITRYPALRIFTAWDSHCLRTLNPSQCKSLQQLSIDNTSVKTLDVTQNTNLFILNVSDTPINSIDLSQNIYLVEFYGDNEGQSNKNAKFTTLDFSNNTYLQRIFCQGNLLTTLDVSKQWNLVSLYAANNHLSTIKGVDINEPEDQRPHELAYLDISNNYFTYSTLPDVDPMTYYYYDLQHEMAVGKEYGVCEAGKLQLGKYILRKGTSNAIVMAEIARDGFSYDNQLFEGTDFTFNQGTGEIEFLTAHQDSVQVAVLNDTFDGVTLLTTRFLVRSAEDYGKPVELMNMVPAEFDAISFGVVTREDETLYVDFGDGVQKPFTTSAHNITNINGTAMGSVRIYGRVATALEAFSIKDTPLISVDVNKQTGMQTLSIVNCGLKDIDLGWNHSLQSINLSNNDINTLDLSGENSAFNKNLLTDLDIHGNKMVAFDAGPAGATLVNMNISANTLSAIDTRDMVNLQTLDASNNAFSELDITPCTSLHTINIAGNTLSALNIAENKTLKTVDITNNIFTLSTLHNTLKNVKTTDMNIAYAPQKNIKVSPVSIQSDLTREYSVGDNLTTFTWKEAETGIVLTEGVDYTASKGMFRFLEPAIGKQIFCELQNVTYPDFSNQNVLRTTVTKAAGQPKYTIAEFTTPIGNQHAILSLAATKDDSYIYIDWGNGELKEYALKSTYTRFEDDYTIQDGNVKVYSNAAEHGDMYVFSIDSMTISNINVTKMTELYCLAVTNAKLTNIDISKNMKLGELNLEGNRIENIDLSAHKALNSVVLSRNGMTSYKLAANNHIAWFMASYNKFETIDWSELVNAYSIDLAGNNISHVNTEMLKDCGQLFLAQNNLHDIDLTPIKQLMVLDISTNYFDFTTLPDPSGLIFFQYGNQAPIDVECVNGEIDLSAQSMVLGTPSQIYFFDGAIFLYEDENGELQLGNEELFENEDFFNDNGIISFAESHEAVTGLIINESYPSLLLYTKTVSVDTKSGEDGIESINSDDQNTDICNITGQRVNASHKGIVIKNGIKILQR